MSLYDEFQRMLEERRDHETLNLFYGRGVIRGMGRDDYGHKRFILFVRGIGGPRNRNEKEERRNPAGRETYVSIAFGENVSPLNIRVDDKVEVIGHITGYSYSNDAWNKGGYIMYCEADRMELAVPVLSGMFGSEAGGFATERPMTRVALKGKVIKKASMESKNKDSTWYRFLMNVDVNEPGRRPSTIWAQYSSRMRVNDVKVEVGDTVCLFGPFSSTRKLIGEAPDGNSAGSRPFAKQETKDYLNVIVDDMCVLKKAAAGAAVPASGFGNFDGGQTAGMEESAVKKRE